MKLRIYRTLNETVRKMGYSLLTSGYEVVGKNDKVVARADIEEGAIQVFACSPDFDGHQRQMVLGGMLKAIICDADGLNSNLSIELIEDNEQLNQRFLERFGFRKNYGNTLVRIAGSIIPPSVV